jgi:ATP-dependent Zn protease
MKFFILVSIFLISPFLVFAQAQPPGQIPNVKPILVAPEGIKPNISKNINYSQEKEKNFLLNSKQNSSENLTKENTENQIDVSNQEQPKLKNSNKKIIFSIFFVIGLIFLIRYIFFRNKVNV